MALYKKYLLDLIEGRTFNDPEYDPNYKGDYRNEVEELETLLSQTAFKPEQMQRRDMLAKKYGINGPQDYAKLPAIKQKELARIAALQQSLVKSAADADASATGAAATQDPKALRTQAAELIKQAEALEKSATAPATAPAQAPVAPTTESTELTRWLKIAGLK
jgi:hypothetical protein